MSPDLPSEIQHLITNYKPEKVILFGSRAKGTAHEDSDYDFLIIKETSTGRLRRRGEALRGTRRTVPLDLLILTPSEFRIFQEAKTWLVKEILSTGKLVYEQPESMVEISRG